MAGHSFRQDFFSADKPRRHSQGHTLLQGIWSFLPDIMKLKFGFVLDGVSALGNPVEAKDNILRFSEGDIMSIIMKMR